jgi:putative flippase GtrA
MEWLTNLFKKDLSTFVRFSLVGAVWTAINIGSDILLIDHWNLPGWLGALIGYVILYIGRYYSYLWLKVLEPQFWKYVYSTAIFTAVMWGMKIVATDFLEYPAMIASPVITLLAFVLKYFFYKSIRLIKE